MSPFMFDNCCTEGFMEPNIHDMDVALDGLDDSYAEWLMGQCRLDMPINNGEDLARAMLAGVGWDDFLASRK
jgi:hypothetical protein